MDSRSEGLPPVVFALLVTNVALFGLEQLVGTRSEWVLWGMLWPLDGPFAPWQLVTYAFLHGGLFHLFVNMFAIWMFGTTIERTIGSRPFALYYAVCIVGAGLVQLLVATWTGGIYPTVGASGGVFGILLAFGLLYPNQMVVLVIPPIPMKAKYFVILFGAFELWAGITGRAPGVAHFAHLGGMVFGFVLLQYWRGRLPVKPRRQLNL